MLTALLEQVRVYARDAQKGGAYKCPGCLSGLVLKKGLIKIHHFAHRPGELCEFARGETQAHLEAKLALHAAFAPLGHRAEVEWPVEGLAGDRRADVFVWHLNGPKLAFELQHTAIGLAEIEERTAGYMAAGIAVVWLPFLRPKFRAKTSRGPGGEGGDWIVAPYRPLPFERWIHTFGFGEIWYWSDRARKIMRGHLEAVAGKVGEEGDSATPSRRKWRLRLWGPIDPAHLAIRIARRKSAEIGPYRLPGGPVARLAIAATRGPGMELER
jgi:Competence protein CoiA-like family